MRVAPLRTLTGAKKFLGQNSPPLPFSSLQYFGSSSLFIAEIMFVYESKQGIMTPETYKREDLAVVFKMTCDVGSSLDI